MDVFSKTNFSALDWAIAGIYLAGLLWLGLRTRKYISNMEDYLTAAHGLRTALGVASMSSTEMALVTVMYSAQKGFVGGFAAFHIAVLAAVATFIVGLTGFIVARLRATGVLTIPEYYARRYGRRTRILGGLMLAFGGILNMGLFLKVAAMFIVALTGLQHEQWLTAVMVALLVMTLLYTMLGGMVADLVTDYAQFVVMAVALLPVTLLAVAHTGWQNMFTKVFELKGPAGFNPLIEGSFGPEYVLWMFFLGVVSCAVWPTSVMRALATENTATVRRLYLWSSVGFLARFLIPYILGICALVYVTGDSELRALFFPTDNSEPLNNLYAVPIFLGRIVPVGLLGVVLAGSLAAEMSTHDSYLLCWSSVLTQDVIAPLCGNRLGTCARIRLTRFLMFMIGIYLVYWGLVYQGSEDIWDYMAVSGAIYFTGAFSLLAWGLYWPRASSTGAVLALIAGASALLGLQPVQSALSFKLSSAWVGLGAVALASLAMVVGSLVFPDTKPKAGGDPC